MYFSLRPKQILRCYKVHIINVHITTMHGMYVSHSKWYLNTPQWQMWIAVLRYAARKVAFTQFWYILV